MISELSQHFSSDEIDNAKTFLRNTKWIDKMPGGFVTNCPKRLVNAYGDGLPIDQNGEVSGTGWDSTFWTAKINQNNITLETKTSPLPEPLRKLIPGLRKVLLQQDPDSIITNHTFTIAVCNYYTDPDMYIAAHRDDNIWYPREINNGASPVFASLTFYPEDVPLLMEEYARFQVRSTETDTWTDIKLDDDSLLIMPSDLEHRVLPCSNRMKHHFKPRINITFRSCYPFNVNPLMNAMAVANHSRYYRLPYQIIYPKYLAIDVINSIIQSYNNCLNCHNSANLLEKCREGDINYYKSMRQAWIARYKNWLSLNRLPEMAKLSPNMVTELFEMIINRIDQK